MVVRTSGSLLCRRERGHEPREVTTGLCRELNVSGHSSVIPREKSDSYREADVPKRFQYILPFCMLFPAVVIILVVFAAVFDWHLGSTPIVAARDS